jgi:hypothetical protein
MSEEPSWGSFAAGQLVLVVGTFTSVLAMTHSQTENFPYWVVLVYAALASAFLIVHMLRRRAWRLSVVAKATEIARVTSIEREAFLNEAIPCPGGCKFDTHHPRRDFWSTDSDKKYLCRARWMDEHFGFTPEASNAKKAF